MGCSISSEEKRKSLLDKIKRGNIIKSFNFDNMNIHSLKILDNHIDIKEITIFSAQHNKLDQIPKKFFANLTKLNKIDFSFNNFDHIDGIIFTKITLVSINFSNNKLSNIPDEIKNLTNLKELNLSHNHITFIPNGVSNLKNLEILDLSSNCLQIFSKFLLEMEKLETVNLSKNSISELPMHNWANSKIKNLDISFNNLSALPSNLLKESNISNLNLKSNFITKSDLRSSDGFEEFEKRRKERKDQGYFKNLDISFNLCGLD